MSNYEAMSQKLGSRQSRKDGNNTYIQRRDDNTIALLYHRTDVVTWYSDGRIVLNSGGWYTYTTKERINWHLSCLTQVRGQWIVSWHGVNYLFADGMTLYSNGRVDGGKSMDTFKAKIKLRTKAQQFARSYITAFRNGKVPPPSNGDCWYCLMRESDNGNGTAYGVLHDDGRLTNQGTVSPGLNGRTMGEMSGDPSDHIMSHIKEQYYVPSLLMRALEVMPASIAMKDQVGRVWRRQSNPSAELARNLSGGDWPDFIWGELAKCLGRYVVRQLGQAS